MPGHFLVRESRLNRIDLLRGCFGLVPQRFPVAEHRRSPGREINPGTHRERFNGIRLVRSQSF